MAEAKVRLVNKKYQWYIERITMDKKACYFSHRIKCRLFGSHSFFYIYLYGFHHHNGIINHNPYSQH